MGLGNAKPDTPAAHRCGRHNDRFAAVQVNGVGQCWQCYLGDEVYEKRFRKGYYDNCKLEIVD